MTSVVVQVRHTQTRVLRDLTGEGASEDAAVEDAKSKMLPGELVVRVKAH